MKTFTLAPVWPSKVTLRFKGRQLTVPFYMGPANTREPTTADVLACLCSDARFGESSFGDFCSDMGLDEDSRKAEATWRACVAMGPRVRQFLGAFFDDISGAEH